MEQFTFYDIYADVIEQLSDDEAGRFIKRLCGYTVLEQEENGKVLHLTPKKKQDKENATNGIFDSFACAKSKAGNPPLLLL